jgi:hypothetical protein
MTSISNIASPGFPTQVVAESPVRAPLSGGIPWTTPGAPAIGSIPIGSDAQIVSVTIARQEFAGGKNTGTSPRAGRDI